jgi:DNA modification methylase
MNTHINLKSIDVILTSPPYNTSRASSKSDPYSFRYDSYNDSLCDEEYIDFICKCFDGYDRVLKTNGCVLFNVSYSSENTTLVWNLISDIQRNTNFSIADCIVWKKKCAIPNNVIQNKLTRICEFIFVLARDNEIGSFSMNKQIDSVSKKGQNIYKNVFNFIDAANNDGVCNLNKATFSTELVRKLLLMYAKKGAVVYDSFMGTGTTDIGAIKENMQYIGSELSKEQCEYANNRIKQETSQLNLF